MQALAVLNQNQPKKKATQKIFQQNVKTINKQLNAMGALQEGSLKNDFIRDYGIQMEMPANYIYESFFYRPNPSYVINAFCQIFPTEVQYLNYTKLDMGEDPKDNDFAFQQAEYSNLFCFKVYKYEGNQYQQVTIRTCDKSYQHKLCFSEDKTRMAIFRLDKTSQSVKGEKNIFKDNQNYVIDIFDCSSIEFFLNTEPLTPKDPSLLYTICDDNLHGVHKFDNSFIRFSAECKYIYINQQRKTILIYNLKENSKDINEPIQQLTIPSLYEVIINVSIDEYDFESSLIAAKKTDFRNIEVFPMRMLIEMQNYLINSMKVSLKSSTTGQQADLLAIKNKYPISSIRIENFNLERTNMRFSADLTQAIYCDDTQHILLELAQEGIKQHQKSMNHLKGKAVRHIQKYGDSEFLVTQADAQDKCISIRHSSDQNKKIKFYFRFKEGSVIIRDIYEIDNMVRILVSRDDEEFIIYEYKNFEAKETFWQRFFENSNYIFEWPYLCYLKGQNHIIVQNAFNPDIVFYIDLQDLSDGGMISNMFISDQYLLYVVVQTKNEYLVYEKDLDKCMPFIFNANQTNIKSPLKTKVMGSQLTSKIEKTKPVAIISKEYLNHKYIYKFYVRGPSAKEVIQTNEERIIFFLCDFKIYSIIGDVIQIVDTGYKFREINPNLLAYNTVDSNNKKTNEVKFLQIAHSDYQKIKIFEETEGKLVEYLVQDGQILVLIQPEKSQEHIIKIFDVNSNYKLKLKYEIPTSDQNLIGSLQTINYYQGNMIPSGNDLYTIIHNGEKPMIHTYENVIPCLPNSGNTIAFYSPLLNIVYRKMIYFVTNKKFLRSKKAIILPYIIDNFIQFNKRTTVTQYCTFNDYKFSNTQKTKTDIMCYVPFTQQILKYNMKGQLCQVKLLKNEQLLHGDSTVAVSLNGKYFLQIFEDEVSKSNLNIVQMSIGVDGIESNITSPSNQKFQGSIDQIIDLPQRQRFFTQRTSNLTNQRSDIIVQTKDHLDLSTINLNDHKYQRINKFYLNELLIYFTSQGCEIVYKINDNFDILIGFLYTNKIDPKQKGNKVLKELLLLKKQGDKRILFKIRPEIIPDHKLSQEDLNKKQQNDKMQQLKEKLIGDVQKANQAQNKDSEYTAFLEMRELFGCYDFTITNEKVLIWSKTKFYSGELNNLNSNSQTMNLVKCNFEIDSSEEAQIQQIYSSGQNDHDIQLHNYYIYIKIAVENNYAFIIKYNINKNKEFASFDCSLDSQIFFDSKFEGYILDNKSIIDIDQGIPLYFYKTGMKDLQKQYLLGGEVSKGSRFCSQNLHFLIRNRIYLPYTYFNLIQLDHQKVTTINNENYDPEAIYFFQGETLLHSLANNYKCLDFILNKYHETNPALLNMLFIKDNQNQNVLQKAIQNGNTRCVKLILDKLSAISMNNIHAVKQNFCDLIEYNGFESYLKLCFFQTNQMQTKQIFQRKSDNHDQTFYIGPHETTFLDKKFHENFQDTSQPMKQVIMRALDAGWILRSKEGMNFQIALSDCENMDYFAIETVKLIVNYQWKVMKPKIILYLFLPFIANMILYSMYCLYSYERLLISKADENISDSAFNIIIQILILLFSIQTFYVEFQQITFHKREYLRSFWNLLDLLTAILAPLTVILDLCQVDPQTVRPIMAICNLIFYLRFFYFLRIFDASAHLVRTIIEITMDIRYFLFVFFLAIIGFGGSFMILSNNNEIGEDGKGQFITSFPASFIYSYRLGLGDFNLDPYEDSTNTVLLHIFFISSSLFSAVILLNMLVAIMGESFNRVNESSEHQRVREHLQLIVENDFLFDRKTIFKHVKYLIEIKDDIEEDDDDLMTQQISSLEQTVRSTHKESQGQIVELKQQISQNTYKMQQMRLQLNQILQHLKNNEAQGLQYLNNESFMGQITTRNSIVNDNLASLSFQKFN